MPASSISRSSRSVSNGARVSSTTCKVSSTVRPPLRSAGHHRSRQRASAARPRPATGDGAPHVPYRPAMSRLAPLLLALLCLAGCARAPAPSALPSEALALHVWPARGPTRAVILALHGFGDAGDLTFEDAARAWSARGIAVYAPDQRGFGGNASRRDWPGADALVGDAVSLAAPPPRPPPRAAPGGGRPLHGRRRRAGRGGRRPRRRRPRPRRPRHRRRRRAQPALPHHRPRRRRRPAGEALDRRRHRRHPPHRQPRGARPRRGRPPPLRRPLQPRALRPRPAHGPRRRRRALGRRSPP